MTQNYFGKKVKGIDYKLCQKMSGKSDFFIDIHEDWKDNILNIFNMCCSSNSFKDIILSDKFMNSYDNIFLTLTKWIRDNKPKHIYINKLSNLFNCYAFK